MLLTTLPRACPHRICRPYRGPRSAPSYRERRVNGLRRVLPFWQDAASSDSTWAFPSGPPLALTLPVGTTRVSWRVPLAGQVTTSTTRKLIVASSSSPRCAAVLRTAPSEGGRCPSQRRRRNPASRGLPGRRRLGATARRWRSSTTPASTTRASRRAKRMFHPLVHRTVGTDPCSVPSRVGQGPRRGAPSRSSGSCPRPSTPATFDLSRASRPQRARAAWGRDRREDLIDVVIRLLNRRLPAGIRYPLAPGPRRLRSARRSMIWAIFRRRHARESAVWIMDGALIDPKVIGPSSLRDLISDDSPGPASLYASRDSAPAF